MIRYAITDRALFAGNNEERAATLVALATDWAVQRIDYVQIREKDLAHGDLIRLSTRIVRAVREHGQHTQILINTNLEAVLSIAVACGADGIHFHGGLSQAQLIETMAALRDALRPVSKRSTRSPLSVSCHSVADIRAARLAGATLALFGPVFEKVVDGRVLVEGIGLAALAEACLAAGEVASVPEIPVCALGGVTSENATVCLAAGAAGVAGIRLFAKRNQAPPSSLRSFLV
jgi:thiamine-phosphate pyrophosphorylase